MYMILPIAFRHHLIIFLICVICFFFFNNLCGNFSKNRQRPQPYVVVNIFYNLFYQCLFFSGKVSERCGEDYLADLEKFGHSWKPIADKTKWTVPEKHPDYYARKCHPGERCVIGHYKKNYLIHLAVRKLWKLLPGNVSPAKVADSVQMEARWIPQNAVFVPSANSPVKNTSSHERNAPKESTSLGLLATSDWRAD